VRVSAVARRWQLCPQQVFAWRREARAGLPPVQSGPARSCAPEFVPIVSEAVSPAGAAPAAPVIEIALAGAVVRVGSGLDSAVLSAVLRAVRSSA
jgi:transposase